MKSARRTLGREEWGQMGWFGLGLLWLAWAGGESQTILSLREEMPQRNANLETVK